MEMAIAPAETTELDVSGVIESLRGLAGVRDVSPTPGTDDRTAATITVEGGADLRPEVFRLAVDRNWVLYELRRETQSLEELFLELTAENGGGAGGKDASGGEVSDG